MRLLCFQYILKVPLTVALLLGSGSALSQTGPQFWQPGQYPSLTPGRAFHVFDSKQQPLQMPELEVRQLFQSMIVASYCHWQHTDFKDENSVLETLERCDWVPDKDPGGKPTFFMPPEAVKRFVRDVEVVDHYPNDAAGFSATLMKLRETGKFVFVVRGIELKEPDKGGDRARDLGALRQMRSIGLALAQIDSGKRYLDNILKKGTIKNGERIDMAGQDVGSHVCFVLNVLLPDLVDKIVAVDAQGYLVPARR